MGISVEATETKATALIAECRRCLAVGSPLSGQYIKDVIAQLESATVNSLTGRTNVDPDNAVDGRNAVEAAAIA
jgi:hypothetical protein